MIKVCHMSSAHAPEDTRIFHKECVSLAKAGYEVYLVVRGDSYEKNGVHITGIGEVTGGRLKRMTEVTRRVYQKALSVDADIYHFHDPELLPYALKLKKKGKKVIFDSHENTLDQIQEKPWIPNYIRLPMFHCFHWFQEFVCRRIDAVISVSPHICEYFETFQSHVAMVTNYPDYKGSALQPNIGSRKLCFAGGISAQWNHEPIIRAIETIPDTKYVLLGSGEESYINQLSVLPGWGQVDYRGKVPHEQVAKILSDCSIGMSVLSPSYNTGMQRGTLGNTKIYEQMMAGLPIICTKFDLWKEMVDKYHCGLCVDPTNADEIASAIRYLLDNPEEAKRMGENGRRAVKEEFNWGVEEKKLLALYEDILKN